MRSCPAKTLLSSYEILRGLPLFYTVQLLVIFLFQIQYHGNDLEISQSHSFFSALSVSQFKELCKLLRQTALLLVVYCTLAVLNLLVSWWPQVHHGSQRAAPPTTIWEHAPWGLQPVLPTEIRVTLVCWDKSSWCNFYEWLWILGFKLRAHECRVVWLNTDKEMIHSFGLKWDL